MIASNFFSITTVKELRTVHNQLKTDLINDAYSEIPYCNNHLSTSIVDLACGRGSDLHKFYHANYVYVVGIDKHAQSIDQARERHVQVYGDTRNANRRYFDVRFFVHDLARSPWYSIHKVDTVVMNYALNYFFETENSLRTLMTTVSAILKPGGYFVGVALDGRRLKRMIEVHGKKTSDDDREDDNESNCTIANEIYFVRTVSGSSDKLVSSLESRSGSESKLSLFGRAYSFRLNDVSPDGFFEDVCKKKSVVEYLVDAALFSKIAAEYGLVTQIFSHPFFVDSMRDDDVLRLNGCQQVLYLDMVFKFRLTTDTLQTPPSLPSTLKTQKPAAAAKNDDGVNQIDDDDSHSGLVKSNEFDPRIYFPIHPNIDRLVLRLTNEAVYSSSKRTGSKKLVAVIRSILKTEPKMIIDGTACCGTDAITLAMYFPSATVWAIEKDAMNSRALSQNVKCYGLMNMFVRETTDIVTFLNEYRCCIEYSGDSATKIDVLYLDFPWGGKNYKDRTDIELYLNDNVSMSDIVKTYGPVFVTCTFVFKTPINFAIDGFKSELDDAGIDTEKRVSVIPYRFRNVVKFNFVVVLVI